MIHVRWMIRTDMPQVLKIEQDTFGDWDENDFLELLRCKNIIGLVACIDNVILGYAIYEFDKSTITIINLTAIMPIARASLIDTVRRKCYKQNRQLCWDTEPTT